MSREVFLFDASLIWLVGLMAGCLWMLFV